MRQIQLKIPEESHGLHARPASIFVKVASTYPCDINVIKDEVTVNGKSILGLMMLALGPGAEFTIELTGDKEEEASLALKKLVESNFQVE